jgi:hypothetical protein
MIAQLVRILIVWGWVAQLCAQTASFSLNRNVFQPAKDPNVNGSFASPYSGNAELRLYNTSGELIKNIFSGSVVSNTPVTFLWDGKNLSSELVASGVYYFWLKLDLGIETKKMIVIK